MGPLVPPDAARQRGHAATYYGAVFEVSVPPSQVYEGVVTDAVSKQPIPGVKVRPEGRLVPEFHAVTDAAGRYRLDGLPRTPATLLIVPPADHEQPYLITRLAVKPAADFAATVRTDVAVPRGTWISARVVNEKTGAAETPVVEYRPDSDNPELERLKGYWPRGTLTPLDWAAPAADGTYKLAGLPGRGFLLVHGGTPHVSAADRDVQGET